MFLILFSVFYLIGRGRVESNRKGALAVARE